MTRYDLVTNYRCGSAIEEMEPSDDGEWLRWEDFLTRHDQLLTQMNDLDKRRVAEIERLRAELAARERIIEIYEGQLAKAEAKIATKV